MVITIEPGLYRAGLGGIRLENTILITSKGPEALNKELPL
jgi:Xaa-Pro aminopeptidase